MAKKKTESFKCDKCKKKMEEAWTLGGFYERYIPINSWYCEKCLREIKKDIDNKLQIVV